MTYKDSCFDVPNGSLNGPKDQLVPKYFRKITPQAIEEFALTRYRICGQGIKFANIEKEFGCNKNKAQRVLKRCCNEWYDHDGKHPSLLFKSRIRTRPQYYYPTAIKADVIEGLKRKKVLIEPTGVVSSLYPSSLELNPFSSSKHSLSIALEYNRANTLLEVLLLIPYQPPFIHNLHLGVNINCDEYNNLVSKQEARNRSKDHSERIGRVRSIRNVQYMMYPNGKIMVYVSCSENPFRLQTDTDVSYFFSFLGQVRDRMVLWLNDVHETVVPSIMEWRLLQCDLNKDIELTETAQMTFPDLQLKCMDRVFRLLAIKITSRSSGL